MWKKLGIGLLCAILAFCALMYWQKGKIEKNITALLAEYHIEAQDANISLLPTPALNLSQASYVFVPQQKRLQAQKLRAEFAFFPLLQGDLQLQSLQGKQAKIVDLNQNKVEMEQLDFELKSQDFKLNQALHGAPFDLVMQGKNAQFEQIQFNAQFSVKPNEVSFSDFSAQLQLAKPVLNLKTIQLKGQQGSFTRLPAGHQHFIAQNVHFNQLPLGTLEAQIAPEQTLVTTESNIKALWLQGADNNILTLESQNQDLEAWLKALNYSPLLTGTAALNGHLIFVQNEPAQGELTWNVQNGKLKNLNLLALLSQYLPINYDESTIDEKYDTKFDRLSAQMQWTPKALFVPQIQLEQKYLSVNAKGNVDLTQNQCDFRANLKPLNQKLSLPVRFYGDCNSPEYKVEINRDFRDKLKGLLKGAFG